MRRLLLISVFIICYCYSYSQTITGSTSFCQGGSTTLTVSGAPGGSTYQWQISNDGGATWTNISGATAIIYNASSAASYTVIVTTGSNSTTLTAVVVTQNPKPIVDFTFTNNNTCSGTPIQFTSSVTSGTAPFTYAWDFGDGNNSTSQNPVHNFISLGCATATFNIVLVVTDANGCSSSITKQITVKQAPDVQVKDQAHPFSEFSNCGNSPSAGNPNFAVTIANISPSAACITSYSVDWGDGNVQALPPQTFPLSHTYTQLGTFNLVVTAVGTNGCSGSKTYVVVNQSNPAVGISGPGGTSGCAPAGFWFKLTNYQLNSPGTIYRWDFGDGSPQIVWTTPITVDSIFHLFTTTSCPLPGSQFTVRVKAINGCDSTEATVNNIKIFQKPVANFTAPATACITSAVPFTNTSIGAYNQGSPACNRTTNYSWNFGDPSSSQNTSTNTSPVHTFSAPGIYNMTLIATGSCGNDTIVKPICIVAVPTSVFLINNNTGCAPLNVNTTNNSGTLNDCTPATYSWSVTYSATNCGTTPSFAFTGGTNSSSINPSFIFNNPGTYTIRLSVTNACGTVQSNQTVIVKKPPTVNINTIPTQCGAATINPTANVTNCGTSALTYSWSFPGGNPASSTLANPGAISYTTSGTYTVSLTVTNECGSTTASQQFNVSVQPASPTAGNNGPICSGSTVNLTSNTSTPGVTYSWTGPAGFTSTQQNPIRNNATVAMSGVYTVTISLNGCSVTATTTVTVNQTPTNPVVTSPVNYCQNATATPLIATSTAGNTLNWYTVATGGTASTTAPTPNTSAIGTTTYYVSQINGTTPACESGRTPIVVNVSSVPNINGSFTDPTTCSSSNGTITLTGLTPNTNYTITYTKNGGAPTTITLTSNASGTIIISNLSGGVYDNITASLNGCVSNAIGPFTLTTPAAPAAPTANNNGPICSGNALNLTANSASPGAAYSWTGPGGFISTSQNPVRPNATAAMSGVYSVTVTLNGCTSTPATTNVSIIQTPTAPIASSPINYCQGATAIPLTATAAAGSNLIWYTVPTGGTPNATPPTPNTSALGSVTYYVSQLTNTNPACEGARTPIIVNVYAVPSITGSYSDPTNCLIANGSITISGLTPNTVYSIQYVKDGGSPTTLSLTSNGSGVIVISNLSAGSYTNIIATVNGCSSNQIAFTLSNPSAPTVSTIGNNGPLCSGSTLSFNSSSSTSGVTYSWTGPNGFTSTQQNPVRPNATTAMNGTYTLIVTSNGCTSTPATTNVTIIQTPTAPLVSSPVNYCQNATASSLTATGDPGNLFNWYNAPTGGTGNTTAPIPNTSVLGSTTYYVSQYTNTNPACESGRAPIVVNVYAVPSINASFINPSNCLIANGSITITGLSPNTTYNLQYVKDGGSPTSFSLISNANGTILISNLGVGVYSNITATLNGCSSNSAGPFTLVNPTAPASPSANSNGPICSGNTLNLTAGSSVSGVTYSWTGPNGFTSTQQNPVRPNSTTSMSGDYVVTITLNGCISSPTTTNVLINQTPSTPFATSPVNYCQNATASPLTAVVTAGNTLKWYTTPTGGTSSANAPTPSTSVIGTTTYYVSQQNSTTLCESARTPIIVSINSIPSIAVTATLPSTCSSSDGTITLSGLNSNTSYTVQYTNNGTNITGSLTSNSNGNIVLNNLPAGTYSNITATLLGCTSNSAGPFTLVNPSGPSTPTVGSNSPLCPGRTLNLTANSSTTGVSYSWIGPNGFTSSLQNPSILNISNSASGRYYVFVSKNNCVSSKDSVDVVISPNPIVDLGPDLTLAPATQHLMTSTIQNGPISQYVWSPSTYLSCTNCPTPVATIQSNISYTLRVTNVNGCVDIDTVNIIVTCDKSQVYIPNGFSPDGDGVNDLFVIRSAGIVTVKYFRIFNKWGELVFEQNNFSTNDFSKAWNGKIRGVLSPPDVFVYTAEIMCENGTSFPFKGNITLIR
jgi:large repetitive protein